MSTFRRLSVRYKVVQHCVDDLACLHCCKCWVQHKKQCEIRQSTLLTKLEQTNKKNQFLVNLNKQLKIQLDKLKQKQQKFGDIQTIKQNMRQEIESAILKQRQVQDELTKYKISDLQNQVRQLKQQITQSNKLLKQYQIQNQQLSQKINALAYQKQTLQQQNIRLKQQNEKFTNQLLQLYETIKINQTRIFEKTDIINKLRLTIGELQGRFLIEKNKANNYGQEKELLEINLKNKCDYISNLTKCTQDNLANLQNLQVKNCQLKHLVGKLDCEIAAGLTNQQYLRGRLVESEERLIVTQGFARYNQQKIALMKNDLLRLKSTL